MFISSNRIIGILLATLVSVNLSAQIKEYNWPDTLKQTPGIDQLKSTFDALILYTIHDINYRTSSNQGATYSVRQRIKIFTELGLNQSAYVIVPHSRGKK